MTRDRLLAFMQRLADGAPRGRRYRVFVVLGTIKVDP